jgi:hypothetical protein
MNLSIRALAIILGVLTLLPLATLADTYHSANFSGQLGSSPNIQPPFAGNGFDPGGAVTGSFVYDDNLIPAAGSGFVNVFFSNFPDIARIPTSTAFTISLGGLSFGLGDADTPMFGTQEAAIQYNNGAFNGFFYISDFMFAGNPYELSIQGGTIAIYPIVGGLPGFNSLVNGTLNIGTGNLNGIMVYIPAQPPPPVPEPATCELLGISLLALLPIAKIRISDRNNLA